MWVQLKDLDAIVAAVRPFTMVCDVGVKFAAQSAIDVVDIPGAIIECGVWKGGCSIAMMLAQRTAFGVVRKPVMMFDSFKGMPLPGEKDGDAARAWRLDYASPAYYNNCQANLGELRDTLASFDLAEGPDFQIVIGQFKHTLRSHGPETIALLRLDSDWYDSTKCCLDHLGPRLSPGALVIVDDYFAWEGCKLAVDEYLAGHPAELVPMPDGSAAHFRISS